ncbi:response regulator [Candidatus Woesearchaeota archaeon]|nr:response regulator [Candidatus Woesearchaeota archaeon]
MGKILIVDDSALMRAVLRNIVKKEGHTTIEAANGEESVKQFSAENPDLIFMDILMPGGMDGLTASKKIKEIDTNANIVMVTSVKEQKEQREASELNIKIYITKPFSREEIVAAMKQYL